MIASHSLRTSSDAEATTASKPRPRVLRALGRHEPPEQVSVGGIEYERQEVLKHDSWAATALYRPRASADSDRDLSASAPEWVVCKFNRQQPICGFPMRWLGRWLAERERHALCALDAVTAVPAHRGPVLADGRELPHAVAHVYVEGHPLGPDERVADDFFPQLEKTLEALHARGIAYVDLHKCENILVGPLGLPHLIDFQVCFIRPRSPWLARRAAWLERALQDMDRYHVQKHLCRNRPDLAGYDWHEFNRRGERPWWIKLHRAIAMPLRTVRRKLLVAIGVRRGKGLACSERT